MTTSARQYYQTAIDLRDRIVLNKTNLPLIKAWVEVARACAKAENAFYAENIGRVHGRSHQSFLSNLDRIAWIARAQVETLGRSVA